MPIPNGSISHFSPSFEQVKNPVLVEQQGYFSNSPFSFIFLG